MRQFLKKIFPIIAANSSDTADFIGKAKDAIRMLKNVQDKTFVNRSQAKKATKMSYLGSTNSSAKIVKGVKKNYNSFVVYLAASDMSGFNVCPMATKGCKSACLVNSGRARMIEKHQKISMVNWARLKKTWLFFFNRTYFLDWLNAEIKAAKNLAKRDGFNFAVRLNGTSDLNVSLFNIGGENLLDIHSDIQFYDYTKLGRQLDNMQRFSNYDVTFSYANSNEHSNISTALGALANGQKISVCFDKESFDGSFPATFLGYEVANGDETDLTFLNELQVLGLDVKRTARKEGQIDNQFIVTKQMLDEIELELAA